MIAIRIRPHRTPAINRSYPLFPTLGTSHKSTDPDPVFPGSYNNPVPHVIPNLMPAVRCSPLPIPPLVEPGPGYGSGYGSDYGSVYASGHGSGSGHGSRYASKYGSECGLGICVQSRQNKIKIFTRRFGFRSRIQNKMRIRIWHDKIYTGPNN
jgi:hypothetical protein